MVEVRAGMVGVMAVMLRVRVDMVNSPEVP